MTDSEYDQKVLDIHSAYNRCLDDVNGEATSSYTGKKTSEEIDIMWRRIEASQASLIEERNKDMANLNALRVTNVLGLIV